jgi:hypothetical protein
MTYLVDANVRGEPTKPAPSSKVIDWLSANERNLVVDSIVLGELYKWFDALMQTIECLPWDATISRRWAKLVLDLKRKEATMPLLDGMIAATALQHDLTIATRNTRDFKKAGLKVFDPFA